MYLKNEKGENDNKKKMNVKREFLEQFYPGLVK